MRKLAIVSLFTVGLVAAIEAAPTDPVTQADLKVLFDRIAALEQANAAQAQRIAELEGKVSTNSAEIAVYRAGAKEEGTEISESGRIYKTENGHRYYLADRFAGIFEPLSESGLKVTPYGYLVFEATHNTHNVDTDWATDFVKRHGNHNTTFSMQDSILGLKFETPEEVNGWNFSGKAEFDLAGGSQNDYKFHWRHLYVDAKHDAFGANGEKNGSWSILFGQTWHLWKMVTPSEFDGAWMENTGHPYRRSPQVRVTRKWDFEDSSLEARIGLVKGGPGMGGDRDKDEIEDNSASAWALVEGAILYDRVATWDTGSEKRRWLVGLGGMYGQDRSHQWSDVNDNGEKIFKGEEDDYQSRMIMLAASVPFWNFTLTGQFYAGENLGSVQAGCAQRVAYREMNRKGSEVSTIGGFIELGYRLNEKWSFAAGYGMDDPTDSKAVADGGIYFNDRAYMDAFYRITSNFKLGLEYAHLRTKYSDEGTKDDDRFQFSAFYDF